MKKIKVCLGNFLSTSNFLTLRKAELNFNLQRRKKVVHFFTTLFFLYCKSRKKTLAQCLELKIIKDAIFSLAIKVHNIDIDCLIDMN